MEKITDEPESIASARTRITRRTKVILLLSAMVLLVVAFLAVAIHEITEKEVLAQFEEHQLLHARHISSQIESYLQSLSAGLKVLSSLVSLRYDHPKSWMEDILSCFQKMKKIHVKRISIYDKAGTVIYCTDGKLCGQNFGTHDFFNWAMKRENRERVLVSLLTDAPEGSLQCLLVTPLYHTDSGRFLGALAFRIAMEELITEWSGLDEPSSDLHRLWILRDDGLLLFQSEKRGMAMRSIRQTDPACMDCHSSFNYAETILKEKKGTIGYQVGDFPRKLAAFGPMQFENASWLVVVNTPQEKVRAFVRKSLSGHLMLLGVVTLVLLGGSVLIYRNYRLEVRMEEEAKHRDEKQALLDRVKRSEASLASQLLRAQEAERWRISSELHDELGQSLSVMKLKIGEIEKRLSGDQEELRLNCRAFLEHIRQTIESVRRLSRDLSPSILKDLGLPAALRWLVREFGKNYHVKTSLAMEDVHPLPARDAQILIYRIIQETLTNIGKHAQATQVSVTVGRENGHILYRVEDNGRGFDPEKVSDRSPEQRGLGLATMKERVRMLGGSLAISSQEEKGTQITFSVPAESGGRR